MQDAITLHTRGVIDGARREMAAEEDIMYELGVSDQSETYTKRKAAHEEVVSANQKAMLLALSLIDHPGFERAIHKCVVDDLPANKIELSFEVDTESGDEQNK